MRVELDLSGSAFSKQFKRADRSGAAACLVLGDAEAIAGTVNLKWLKSGEQTVLNQVDMIGNVEDIKQQLITNS